MRTCFSRSIPTPGLLLMVATMDRFEASNFNAIEYADQVVWPFVAIPVTSGDRFTLEWVSIGSPRTQGLAFRLRDPGVTGRKGYAGTLRAGGATSPVIFVWKDTSPSTVSGEVVEVSEAGVLRVSNRWRTGDGVEHEWLNNYGIVTESLEDGALLLHCSDGVGEAPSFDDMVVKLQVYSKDGVPRHQDRSRPAR